VDYVAQDYFTHYLSEKTYMTVPENLPAAISSQGLAILSKQPGSLVLRGLAALKKDNDTLYRQARAVFEINRKNLRNLREHTALFAAFNILQKLAEANYGMAYYPLSILDRREHHISPYAQMAFDWCFENQKIHDAELWWDLGEMYREGDGVERSWEKAAYWVRKAAEQGNTNAQFRLGDFYKHGEGVDQNSEQAVYWLRKAAEQGNADAQFSLSEMYHNGDGVEKSHELKAYWLHKLVEQGDARGACGLGEMYSSGLDVESNPEQALYWYSKAADQGYAFAPYKLGVLYRDGKCFEQDNEQAIYWFCKVAEQRASGSQIDGFIVSWAQEALKILGADWEK